MYGEKSQYQMRGCTFVSIFEFKHQQEVEQEHHHRLQQQKVSRTKKIRGILSGIFPLLLMMVKLIFFEMFGREDPESHKRII